MFEWLRRETHPVFIYGKTVTLTTEKKQRWWYVEIFDTDIAELEKASLFLLLSENICGWTKSLDHSDQSDHIFVAKLNPPHLIKTVLKVLKVTETENKTGSPIQFGSISMTYVTLNGEKDTQEKIQTFGLNVNIPLKVASSEFYH